MAYIEVGQYGKKWVEMEGMYAQRTEFRYENIFVKAGNIKNYKNLRTICFGHWYR